MNRRIPPAATKMGVQRTFVEKTPQLPTFLQKLSSILEDPELATIIQWNQAGDAFYITNPYQFSRTILPQYFKHNNINSFIRQLNLYGFRKILPTGKAQEAAENLHFAHPNFLRDRPNLMFEIKRNTAAGTRRAESSRPEEESLFNPQKKTVLIPEEDLVFLIRELKFVRDRQNTMKNTITQLTRDNILLWQEMAHLRSSQAKQQENVSKLVQFLVGVVQPAQRRQPNNSQRIVPLEEELEDAVARANTSGSQMNYAENPNNRLALQCGGQLPFRTPGSLDCAVLDEIVEEMGASAGASGQFSLDAETALLNGLQLRQRAIEEKAQYLENGLLNGGEQNALERPANLRNELNFRYDLPSNMQNPFKRHVLSPSPSTSLYPKRPLHMKERPADPRTIQLSSETSSSALPNYAPSSMQQADGQEELIDPEGLPFYLDGVEMEDDEDEDWHGLGLTHYEEEENMNLMPGEGEMEHEQPQQHLIPSKRR